MQRNEGLENPESRATDPEVILEKQLRCHMKILAGCCSELQNLVKLEAHLKAALPEKEQELILE